MNGTDYMLYLVFLRYAAWLCFVITAIDIVVFVPLYLTGDPKRSQNDKWSTMNVLTFLNITAIDWKCLFVYVSTLLMITGLSFYALFRYKRKY